MVTEAILTTQEVADRFHALAQEGKWHEIQSELFSQDAESIEPATSQGLRSVKGLSNIKEKGKAWEQMIEATHGGYCSKPLVAGKHFVCTMGADVTMKGQGRVMMDEVALYEVKDGKIIKEEFFY